MASKRVRFTLPRERAEQIDERVRGESSSRSAFVRRTVATQLRADRRLESVLDRANERGYQLGFTTERAVYDAIER